MVWDYLNSVLHRLSLDVIKTEPIVHEDALSSSIFKITLRNSSQFIVKILFDAKRWKRECFFLQEVKRVLPVPKIAWVVAPSAKERGAIVMEYLKGEVVSLQLLTDAISFQMGELLAKLHQIPTHFYGDVAENEKLTPELKNGLSLIETYFWRSFKECERLLEPALLDRACRYFASEIEKVKVLDGPCIAHRDFKPGNILIDKGKIKGLIDWEIAKFHFAEEDFAHMEYLVWENHPETKGAFLEGYRSIRLLPPFEEILPLLRFCKALGAIGFTIERETWKGAHRFVFEKNIEFLNRLFQRTK